MSGADEPARLIDEAAARASASLTPAAGRTGAAAQRRRLRIPSRAGIMVRVRRVRRAAGRAKRAVFNQAGEANAELSGFEVALTSAEMSLEDLADEIRSLHARLDALTAAQQRLAAEQQRLVEELGGDRTASADEARPPSGSGSRAAAPTTTADPERSRETGPAG